MVVVKRRRGSPETPYEEYCDLSDSVASCLPRPKLSSDNSLARNVDHRQLSRANRHRARVEALLQPLPRSETLPVTGLTEAEERSKGILSTILQRILHRNSWEFRCLGCELRRFPYAPDMQFLLPLFPTSLQVPVALVLPPCRPLSFQSCRGT